MRLKDDWTGVSAGRRLRPPGPAGPVCARLVAIIALALGGPGLASAQVITQIPPAPDTPAPTFTLSPWMQALNEGDLDGAAAAAAQAPAPAAAYVRGRIAERRGDHAEAEAAYRATLPEEPVGDASMALADLLVSTGRADEARAFWEAALATGQRERTAPTLRAAAIAAQRLGRVRLSNSYFQTAAGLSPPDPALHTAWGDLFLEKYNEAEARASYDSALKIYDRWVPALVGLARSLADTNPTAAERAARQVLSIDASNPDALVLLASQAIDAVKRDDARRHLDRVLEANPRHVEALALSAAIAQIEDDTAAVDRLVSEALRVHPTNGHVYRIVGERVARQYRFDEAVTFLRRAVEIDPGNSRAQATLGLHLLRTGDEAEARKALETAFAADSFDAVTYNLLSLLDTLDGFTTDVEGMLTVRLHAQDAPVLRQYLVPLAVEALESLSKRYDFTPTGPILVEVFPRHDDFAVRTMGLPGMLGALGACFGRVVTMDSPRARPPGTFNWAATLWHELAHVITLQMSGNRLPRWLSEGVSGYEEMRARPGWGLESQLLFAQAYASGRLVPLAELNAAFTRGETINLAYFQAAVLVGHLVERFGEPALFSFIRSFATGPTDEEALRASFDTDWGGLQTSFDAHVDARYGNVKAALANVSDQPPGRSADAGQWAAFADRHAGNFRVQMAAATPLIRLGDLDAAQRVLERAAALVPFATGEDSPWRLLATVATRRERPEDARRYMARLLEVDHTAAQPLRQLLALAREAGDDSQRKQAADRLIEIDPFDAAAHTALGELALARGDLDAAMRELQTAVEAGPANPAEALTSLADVTLRTGQVDQAKQHLIRALESTPRYERAQDLLLQIVDGPRGGGGAP
jgi:tetratricopeptide (TPR) repeat protein